MLYYAFDGFMQSSKSKFFGERTFWTQFSNLLLEAATICAQQYYLKIEFIMICSIITRIVCISGNSYFVELYIFLAKSFLTLF